MHTCEQCCQYLPLITPCPCSGGVALSIKFVKLAAGHFDRPGGSGSSDPRRMLKQCELSTEARIFNAREKYIVYKIVIRSWQCHHTAWEDTASAPSNFVHFPESCHKPATYLYLHTNKPYARSNNGNYPLKPSAFFSQTFAATEKKSLVITR